jgi:hypothetical protein
MTLDNEITFLDALLYAREGENPSKAIENQEKRGQQMVVEYRRLPKATNHCSDYHKHDDFEFTKAQYEKMGIKIIDEYDDLFWNVQLPDGWEIKATTHTMWNDLIDDKGRKRATFFYKAAFYDRDAFINFKTRYTTCIDHTADYEKVGYKEWRKSPTIGYIMDCEESIYSTATKDSFDDYSLQDKVEETIREELENYMVEHYPDYKDVNAYWD